MYVDIQVIQDLRNHDEKAFKIVYDNYYRLLYFIVASYIKNKEDINDILQDVFLKIYTRINSLKNNKDFHQWVGIIARNTALDFLKKNKNLYFEETNLNLMKTEQPQTIIFNTYLTNLENQIFTLKVVYDFTFKQISKLTKIKNGKVYLIYQTALEKVKNHYKEEIL